MIQPLALGGITYGVSDLELTAAYAAIADGGQYRKPVFYTKVTDSKGNVLIDNTENKATQVFKASTASLLTNVMEDVLEKGTGVAARLDNMHAAGKNRYDERGQGSCFCRLYAVLYRCHLGNV